MVTARHNNLPYKLGLLIFVLILMVLAYLAVIPKLAWDANGPHLAETGRVSGFNFIPLRIFADSWQQARLHGNLLYFFINFVGNIGVFLPLGFFPPLLWRISRKKVLRNAFLCSLFIEVCQIPQARGTDIDDLWLNTIGALLGYLLYRLLEKKAQRLTANFKKT